VIGLLLIFSRFWQWNNFENRLIFDDVKAYKTLCHFGGHPVCHRYSISSMFRLDLTTTNFKFKIQWETEKINSVFNFKDTAHSQFLVNVNSRLRYVVVRPSIVCLSETYVRPTLAIKIFGNVSMPFGTLAICRHSGKILRRSFQGNPFIGGVKH